MKIRKTYYGVGVARHCYDIPILNNGKMIPRLDRQGNPVYSGNKPVYLDERREFNTIQSERTAKSEPLCIKTFESDDNGMFTPDQEREIAMCEKMVKDPHSPVVSEDTYKARVNPAQFATEKELEKVKREAEARTKIAVEEATAGMNKQIADLQKQLAELVESKDSPKRGRPPKSE